jgi:hypothetical protein
MDRQPKKVVSAEATELEDPVRTLLLTDHGHFERSLQAIVAEVSDDGPADLREPWHAFEQELLAHLDAEEADLIRVFGSYQPTEARELIAEHEQIRATVTQLGVDLDLHCLRAERVKALVDQLRAHARREEGVLYPWATERLGVAAARQLGRILVAKRLEARMRTKR